MRLTVRLERHGASATGIEIPAQTVAALGAGGHPKVRATLGGYTYRTSIGRMGGRYLLPVSAEVRTRAGVRAGDQLDLELEVDADARTVEVPEDLAHALGADPVARAAFDRLPVGARRRHALSVATAKAADTRARRVRKILDQLHAAG